ncbi:DNA repair exonuclease [Leptospira gomenensis]|uniref:DNA repair exonuclease n=1 Tax=Leptospira gomenensis TaxID=2484974 RepID=A0A5F1YK46_9LEPT|nr:metallophosphoesterase [Leptospira gomenensis]TGK33319.1 DNA repair exonuclease [Leptospira gomenensis]TGK37385.1 DNA repair exonuclease [Leptospira gomenensis]TGK50873.1 DNA repair exonuclease [Leptospira gomenensis]TGK56496.1 DNA repair exonuclease [Leptospira gomenensis]
MIRVLHTADLHLSQKEKEYCLSVLKEIVSIAGEEKCTHILICGDLFDRNGEIDPLKDEVKKILGDFGGKILYIPGNHEELGLATGKYPITADLSPLSYPQKGESVKCWTEEIDGVTAEFFGFPFQRNLEDSNIRFKEKKTQYRIALLHGTETELVEYLGPSPEEADSVLDSGPFSEAHFDYLALGHIHSGRSATQGSMIKRYPGSPRVVSSGEFGPRTVTIVSFGKNGTPELREKIVVSAGQYREFSATADLSGKIPELETIRSEFGVTDSVRIRISGIVEDEHTVSAVLKEFEKNCVCRRMEFKTEIKTSAALINNPIAKVFYDKLMERKAAWTGAEPPDWNRVLTIGLEQIEENAGKN